MTNEEITEFIINRLAELVVVLFNDYVGNHAEAAKARIDARLILVALAKLAAGNDQVSLVPVLRKFATQIRDVQEEYEPEPQFYDPAKIVHRINYRW